MQIIEINKQFYQKFFLEVITTLPSKPKKLEMILLAEGINDETNYDAEYLITCKQKRIIPYSEAELDLGINSLSTEIKKIEINTAVNKNQAIEAMINGGKIHIYKINADFKICCYQTFKQEIFSPLIKENYQVKNAKIDTETTKMILQPNEFYVSKDDIKLNNWLEYLKNKYSKTLDLQR